jgi:hypothetical protein
MDFPILAGIFFMTCEIERVKRRCGNSDHNGNGGGGRWINRFLERGFFFKGQIKTTCHAQQPRDFGQHKEKSSIAQSKQRRRKRERKRTFLWERPKTE